jgi:hypothetical protein
VFILRDALNYVFYAVIRAPVNAQLLKDHPGVLREVIPGYVATDLLTALILTYLVARGAGAFGGGIKGGACLGIIAALLMGVAGNLYVFFGVTFIEPGRMVQDMIYEIVSMALQGALAGKLAGGKAT